MIYIRLKVTEESAQTDSNGGANHLEEPSTLFDKITNSHKKSEKITESTEINKKDHNRSKKSQQSYRRITKTIPKVTENSKNHITSTISYKNRKKVPKTPFDSNSCSCLVEQG